ncbi:hypothetical protein [Acetobacterium tundrae]|uniref:Uncharacterized protein n=1 Tax=Acetobacterium tundrae TaxID=132932 RepID=A0ABR6WNW7_9FIRM|nr:hypothetical protein [Acetobacterium tundrae]MBC3798011.1 hypothetical protein [Acetobacterium tundrae]
MIAKFFALRIINGDNTYIEVVTAKPNYKTGIDAYLTENGHAELIVTAAA